MLTPFFVLWLAIFVSMPYYLYLLTYPRRKSIAQQWQYDNAVLLISISFFLSAAMALGAAAAPFLLLVFYLIVPVLWFMFKVTDTSTGLPNPPYRQYWTPQVLMGGAVLGAYWVIAVGGYYYTIYDFPIPQ